MNITDIEKAREKLDDTMFPGDYAENQAVRATLAYALDLTARYLKLRETHKEMADAPQVYTIEEQAGWAVGFNDALAMLSASEDPLDIGE